MSVLLPGDQDIVFAGQYLFSVAASQDRVPVLCGPHDSTDTTKGNDAMCARLGKHSGYSRDVKMITWDVPRIEVTNANGNTERPQLQMFTFPTSLSF
jgi:hypothetical protein